MNYSRLKGVKNFVGKKSGDNLSFLSCREEIANESQKMNDMKK